MNDSLERSRPMEAYADTYGEPDMETTSRMRSRILDFMEDRAAGRTRVRHWAQAAVAIGVLAIVGAGAWWWQGSGGDDLGQQGAAGVIATVDQAQEVELDHGGSVRLLPHSGIRIRRDAPERLVLDLLEGELELSVADSGSRELRVDTGEHEVEIHGTRVAIRRTRGVPLVTVHEGHVRLFGPDLPADGVRIVAAE